MFFSQHQWWVMESRVPLQAGGEWYLADWRAMGPILCFHGWSTVYSPLKGEQLKGDPTLISLSLHHTDPGKSWGFCWPSSKNLNFWVISIQDNVLGIHSTNIPRARFPLSLIKAQQHYASTPRKNGFRPKEWLLLQIPTSSYCHYHRIMQCYMHKKNKIVCWCGEL